jgi:hypothetical protein
MKFQSAFFPYKYKHCIKFILNKSLLVALAFNLF